MKKTLKIIMIAGLSLTGVCILLSIVLSLSGGRFSITLPVEHKSVFAFDRTSQFPGRLYARGNRIVDANGRTVLLRGLMPPDPARLRLDGVFNQKFFAEMSTTGANVFRIPVHPENWVRDRDYLWRYLDPIVAWAGDSNIYVIIDWHYIGNVATGAGPEMPDIEPNPKDLTMEFWRSTAQYFRNVPNVIFEIFNEPQSIGAEEWHSNATDIIRAIREQGADQLVIVGGIDYGKDLSWVMDQPIPDENIAYASHIYPAHSSSSWGYWFGTVAEKYPVMITEWGFMEENGNSAQSYLAGDQITYGSPFLSYLSDRNIGWIACWYDDQWSPPMFTEGRKSYTRYGEFVMQQLKEEQ
jgi:aryl-phospho-beta-D-glucosidase BglC (GH1 family)